MIFEDKNMSRTIFPQPLLEVDVPSGLHSVGVRAYISNFSVPPDTPTEKDGKTLRGIANVGFIYPKDDEEIKNETIQLLVFVSETETTLYKLKVEHKGPSWEVLSEQITKVPDIEPWIGYIEAEIPLGDPPIAVG